MISFEQFWADYPRKVGRFKAEKCWAKLSMFEREDAMKGLKLWKQAYQWHQMDGLYIPYGSTFLQQKRYYDEPWKGAFDEHRTDAGIQA